MRAFAFTLLISWWLVIPIWLYEYSRGKSPLNRDWRVGDKEFDKRFTVASASHEQALRALPRALQELIVREDMRGPLEVKPGLLALPHQGTWDAPNESAVQ